MDSAITMNHILNNSNVNCLPFSINKFFNCNSNNNNNYNSKTSNKYLSNQFFTHTNAIKDHHKYSTNLNRNQSEIFNQREFFKMSTSDLDTNLGINKTKTQGIKPSDTEEVRLGKCKWFNVAKGWGFITPNDGGQEVFVHQSVIQMSGFRSLGEQEEVEFECKITDRGLEATRVSGPGKLDCTGTGTFRPRPRKRYRRVRCYNCGEFANHIASKCDQGPQPKRCHNCKSLDHLLVDCCPKNQSATTTTTSQGADPE